MGSKSSKSRLSKSSSFYKKKDKRKNILNEYKRKVAQKHQEYAKVVSEIDKFKPNTLKELILTHIDKENRKLPPNKTTTQLRKYLEVVKAQEFVNTLHLFCWQFITSSEFSVLDMNEINTKQIIAEVLKKIATTKKGLIRNLVKLFDELMTLEYTDCLKSLIEQHSNDDTPISEIIKMKKLNSIIVNENCFDETFESFSTSFNIIYDRELMFKKIEKMGDLYKVKEAFDGIITETTFLSNFICDMVKYFVQFLGLQDDTIESLKDVIDEANNMIMFSSRGNLRSICLYLMKMQNFDMMDNLEKVIQKFKFLEVDNMEDITILMKQIEKMRLKRLKNPAKVKKVKDLRSVSCTSEEFVMSQIRDLQLDESGHRRTINLLHSKAHGKKELFADLKDFSSKLDKCESQGLYYSINIINSIHHWIINNFGMPEPELKIDIIKVIIRKISHSDIANHIFLLRRVCLENTLDNNSFFALIVGILESEENHILGTHKQLGKTQPENSEPQSQNKVENGEEEGKQVEAVDKDIEEFFGSSGNKGNDEYLMGNLATRDSSNNDRGTIGEAEKDK